ncbi:MAG: hypothetical protein NXH89_16560, partial [Cyclobacteriaceae bacterium]|nr:hypothetical protein [Cyclobacteriaceae bacterium]
MRKSFFAAFFFASQLAFGQLSRTEIITSSESNLRASLLEFREYLSLPNNGKIGEDISLNLNWTQAALEDLGFQTQILTGNGIPHLFAQGKLDPEKKTILVYMQVDGQPVDST